MAAPIVPEYITVHLGTPRSNAENIRVPFPEYIKNVASSEIYPTWPENALRANIYAQTTFALNRIYTEHYRAQGYDFDITNSTQYDQAYKPGHDVFQNVSELVDELFNNYVVKQGQVQPYFTQYCNGTTVTCAGLSQWGTVTLANRGLTPYQILQRYYGDDINIVYNAPIKGNIPSYPGTPLRLGSAGEDVTTIQRQLNRISSNYPAIPKISVSMGVFESQTQAAVKTFQKIFNLTQDGIVGRTTWYKIKYIYNGIKRLSELYSEGITISEDQRQFSKVLQRGDRGYEVGSMQYYLNFIGKFNPRVPEIAVDRIFGKETYNAVLTFQRLYGLTPDGIVGRNTWNMIQNAYIGILNSLPNEYKSYSSLYYPGYFITTGATGNAVTQIQVLLRTISQNDPSVPSVIVDGIYGPETAAAVREIQRRYDIPVTGQVGPLTWNAIVNLYNEYR